MIFVEPHLFAITDGGVATCMDAKSGVLNWQERAGGNVASTPVAAGGRIFFLADDGTTTVIEAGPSFNVLAKNPLEGRVQASMAVSQGHVFIRTDSHLFCIGVRPTRRP